MSELYGYMDDGDVLNGGMDEIAKVVGHSDWGEIGGQLSDQEDLQDALDKKADKARVDILEKLTLGQVWDYDPYDETVYQQTVPAGGHGVEMESVGGRSVVWNQQLKDNEGHIVEQESSAYKVFSLNQPATKAYMSHRYLLALTASGIGNLNVVFGSAVADGSFITNMPLTATPTRYIFIASPNVDLNSKYEFRNIPAAGICKLDVTDAYVIDLTLLFGSGNEPTSTSDPRIAWIEAYASEHPEYNAGEVVHGEVTGITESGTADTPIDYPIPAEVQALEGYGWGINSVSNTVGFKNKKHTQRIFSVDLSTLQWSQATTSPGGRRFYYTSFPSANPTPSASSMPNVLSEKYSAIPQNMVSSDTTSIPYICVTIGSELRIIDDTTPSGTLYYEGATDVETDISQYIDDSWQTIETEPNGSITFQNDNLLPVPVKDRFKVKLTEALA